MLGTPYHRTCGLRSPLPSVPTPPITTDPHLFSSRASQLPPALQSKSPKISESREGDLEELEALTEEEVAGGGGSSENQEKEMLMERIQSLKEEKQVSLSPASKLCPSTLQAGSRVCVDASIGKQVPSSWDSCPEFQQALLQLASSQRGSAPGAHSEASKQSPSLSLKLVPAGMGALRLEWGRGYC